MARTASGACAEGVKSTRLKTLFEEAAERCAQGAAELEAKVRSLGGDPTTSGSVGGSLHRGWIDIKSTITGMDEAAILAECERGEDAAKRHTMPLSRRNCRRMSDRSSSGNTAS